MTYWLLSLFLSGHAGLMHDCVLAPDVWYTEMTLTCSERISVEYTIPEAQ